MNKLSIFVSSRTHELHNERVMIQHALKDFDFNTFIFEDDSGARTESPEKIYRTEVKNSHIYVGIFREEYSSATEDEYRIAKENGKEILIYVSDYNIIKKDEKLKKLLELLKIHTIEKFNDVKELESKIKHDIAGLLARKFLDQKEGKTNQQPDFTDPEFIKHYLTKISPNNPRSLEIINPVAGEIMSIWKIMGYEIHKCDIEGSTIIFEGKVSHWTKDHNVIIRCVNGELTTQDVISVKHFIQNHKDVEGLAFAYNRISESAKHLALESPQIIVQTQSEFYEKLMRPDKYLNNFIKNFDDSEIPKYYTSLNCYKETRKDEFSDFTKENYGEIEQYVDKWLDDKSRGHLSLLGDFGAGKTWFARRLTRQCIDKYLQDPNCNRLPIFISLRDYAKSYSIQQLITDLLVNTYGFNFRGGFEEFQELNRQGRFILIFDGFDEMAKKVDYNTVIENFWQIAKVALPNSKVLLTCRSTYFRYEIESQKILGGKEKTSVLPTTQTNFETIYLQEFSEEKIIEVMSKRIGNKEQALDYWGRLKNIYDIPSIAQKPLLIPMLIQVMPQLLVTETISPTIIYFIYVNLWIQRSHKEGRTFLKTEWQSLFFVKELAWHMTKIQNLRILWNEIPDFINQYFKIDSKDLDYYSNDLRTNLFLTRDEKGYYEFDHKSMTEFFVAFKFALDFGNIKKVFSNNIPKSELEKKSISELAGTFGHQLLTPEITLYLKDLIASTVDLRNLFYESKSVALVNQSLLTSNLITLLTQLKEPFENEDISRANMPDADLTHAHLIKCKFDGGNLSNCLFNNADVHESNFDDCNLVNCNLENANFSKTIMNNANLTNCRARRTNFHYSELTNCNLTNVNLINCKLTSVDFDGVTALSADFTNSNFTDSILENGEYDKCNFNGVNLTNVGMKNSSFTNCTFYDAVTLGVELTNCNLAKSIFENADLQRVKFGSAILKDVTFLGSDMTNSKFTNADMRDCNLINTILEHAIFDNCDLNSAKLNNANLLHCVFKNCNLRKSDFTGIDGTRVLMDDETSTTGLIINEKSFKTFPILVQKIIIRDNFHYEQFLELD